MDAFEDTMKLWVTAEAGLESSIEHRLALASAIDFQVLLHSQAIAKVHHCKPGLLLE